MSEQWAAWYPILGVIGCLFGLAWWTAEVFAWIMRRYRRRAQLLARIFAAADRRTVNPT